MQAHHGVRVEGRRPPFLSPLAGIPQRQLNNVDKEQGDQARVDGVLGTLQQKMGVSLHSLAWKPSSSEVCAPVHPGVLWVGSARWG